MAMSRRYYVTVSTGQLFESMIHGERIPFEQNQRLDPSRTSIDALSQKHEKGGPDQTMENRLFGE